MLEIMTFIRKRGNAPSIAPNAALRTINLSRAESSSAATADGSCVSSMSNFTTIIVAQAIIPTMMKTRRIVLSIVRLLFAPMSCWEMSVCCETACALAGVTSGVVACDMRPPVRERFRIFAETYSFLSVLSSSAESATKHSEASLKRRSGSFWIHFSITVQIAVSRSQYQSSSSSGSGDKIIIAASMAESALTA